VSSDGVLFMSSPGNLGFLVCNGDASVGAAWKRRKAVQRREGAGEALPILPARVRRDSRSHFVQWVTA
jgi:hypothetical protein